MGPSLLTDEWEREKAGASAAFEAPAVEAVVVFGRRHDRPIHAARRPASEKRQGTKSRGGDGSGAAGAMGILPRAQAYEF
jgi:hypothetical protein